MYWLGLIMSLWPNIMIDYYTPTRCIGSAVTNPHGLSLDGPQMVKSRFAGSANVSGVTSIPIGYAYDRAWSLALNDGGLAALNISGIGSLLATGACGVNLISSPSGIGLISASILGPAWLVSTVNGSGSVSASIIGAGIIDSIVIPGLSSLSASIDGKGFLDALIAGMGLLGADLAGGFNMESNISGVGAVNATLDAIGHLISALAGSANISADISGGVLLSASLAGSGSVSPDLMGVLWANANLAGSGNVSGLLSGLAFMSAILAGSASVNADIAGAVDLAPSVLHGSGSITAAYLDAKGVLECVISIGVRPTPEEVASAVWMALSSMFNVPGTMGKKMNDAGGGSSPSDIAAEVWRSVESSFDDPGTMGRLLHTASSSGHTVEEIADGVWAKTGSGGETTLEKLETIQTDIGVANKILSGRWKIVNNQMIFYDDDGVTPLLTFDLYNSAGTPSMINVFERRRV